MKNTNKQASRMAELKIFSTPSEQIHYEYAYAKANYPDYRSIHEARGVLQEEILELDFAIHDNDIGAIREELAQIAAVAQKALDGIYNEL